VWLHRGRTWTAVDGDHPGEPDHQADSPLAAIELILATT
jgi:hypothetical protein